MSKYIFALLLAGLICTINCDSSSSSSAECPLNERYVNNINEICRAKTCSELDQHLPCQLDGYCNTGPPGCICIDGYVRNADGVCVPNTECPPICSNGEVYEKCPDPCVPNTCEVIYSTYKPCPPCPEDCKPTCRCPDGQFRNKIGQCVTSEECLICKGPHEYFACGGACDNECDKLSRQSKNNCPIVNIQCNRMCYCEDGYARDANNTCIPINECPPECPLNERYVNNINEICRAKTCLELDQHLPCPVDGCCATSPPGCICIDGYVRNGDGVCVPTNECPMQSRERPLEENKINILGQPEFCGPNEVVDDCVNGGCGRRNCSELAESQKCIDVIYCIRGCRCRDGYLRDENGRCVPLTSCPIPNCKEGEIFDFCPGYCQPECSVDQTLILCKPSPQPGDPDCNPACRCADNLYRTTEGTCVPKEHCPLTCPYGEVYEDCPDPCTPNVCESIRSRFKRCPPAPEDCKPTCRCPEGQFRSSNGQCITGEECLKCRGPHEYFSCGEACDNECDKLSRQSKNNCPIVNIQCNRMCYCEDGYARDANNTCIPINECPPECPLNEQYVNNINEICRAMTCSELDQHLPCQLDGYCNTGPPGCICIDGYVRNGDGVCVPTNECPPKCPNGEVYEDCPDPCVPNTCASIWSRFKPCPPRPEDCKPTCRCPDGLHRNKIGQCITTEECLQCMGPYEYFSCGGACDNECDKLSLQSITNCPIVNIQCNRKCYCEDGYARDANNTCIPINECPPECPVNEHHVMNINEICRAKTCSEHGEPLPCLYEGYDNSGPPGCICNDGFIRNCDGLCVPTSECLSA